MLDLQNNNKKLNRAKGTIKTTTTKQNNDTVELPFYELIGTRVVYKIKTFR